MSKQLTMKAGVAMFAALALVVALAIYAFSAYQPVAAQETTSDNVARSFSSDDVATGGTLDVTITFDEFLAVVTVTETLPDGWTYQSVMPSDVDVTTDGQDISFEVIGGQPVVYTVMAPVTAGSYTFSGTVAEQDGASVGGPTMVNVAVPGSTPDSISGLAVNPTSAKPGEAVTVTGMGSPAGATVYIFIADTRVVSASISSNGSFAAAFIVPDDASGGSNTVGARASASATENLATATLMVEPTLSLSPTSINNDVDSPITAEIRGFMSGAVTFTAGDVALGSGSGPSVGLTIGADVLAPGNVRITATQGSLSAMAYLEVVTPAIMLSAPPMDNSEAFDITVTGSNFDTMEIGSITGGGSPTAFAPDAMGDFEVDISLAAGTEAGEVTITATSGGYDATASFMLTQAPPAQVTGVVVTPLVSSLAVSWAPVRAMTGAEVRPAATGYMVEWKEVGPTTEWSSDTVSGGDLTYYEITGLDAGKSYMVQVSAMAEGTAYGMTSAINSQSVGEPKPVPVTVEATAPGLVRNLSASAVSDTALSVSWNAPASDGGSAITGYDVGYRVFGSTTWMDAEHTGTGVGQSITGLTAGTWYEVRVAAMNGEGTGPSVQRSARTMNAPPATVQPLAPAAPMNVTVITIDHDRLSVSWDAPAMADNTPAITGYVVRYKTIDATKFGDDMDANTMASHVLTGLDGDTTYLVQVAAVNSVGTGAYGNGQGQTDSDPVKVTPPARIKNGVELSSNGAGATVRIDIDADADTAIAGGEDIVVELPKFGLPSSIDTSDVLIDSDGYSGNPSDVTVSGSKITIEVPTREGTSGGSTRANIPAGDYSIKLKQGAGITNPAAAGSQTVTITDEDAKDEEYSVTIMHVVSLSSDSVTRGDDLTLTIRGYANGTATVYVAAGKGDKVEIGQVEVSGNVGEFAIDTSASDIKAGMDNKVTVRDSKGEDGGKNASDSFTIKPKVVVDPESTTPSKEVTIKLSDWPASVSISSVSIGGEDVPDVSATTDSKGAASFKVMVPRDVNTGTQTVSVKGGKTTASTTIGINVLLLTISPAEAVPGQQVTISGSGFAGNKDVTSLTIGGGEDIKPDDASSTSSGNVSVTIKLPLDVGSGTKEIELEVEGRVGEGELTVPKPSIELDPATSVPGSVISVTGSGFAANERVEVSFRGAIEEIGRADGNGNVSVRLDIPSDAGVGSTNEVMVKVRPSDTETYADLNINAKADHKTPGPAITVSAQAQVGDTITISGTNFASFSTLTTVAIGGLDAKPSPAPETDKNGAFSFEARVPRLSAGSHTVTIRDNRNNSVTETFEVVTTPVVSTPEEVFGGLTEAGVLGSVWRYSIDETGFDWDSYDPQYADQPGINDLEFVARGDIVWIRVTENTMFQGATLYAGWNLRTLE